MSPFYQRISSLIRLPCAAFYAFALQGANWMNDLDVALKVAEGEKKPLLVYFTGDWCVWCNKLDADFFNKLEFEQLASQLLLVKLDYPQESKDYSAKQKRWKQAFQIYNFPSVLVLSATGKLLGDVGYPRDSAEEYFARIRRFSNIPYPQDQAKPVKISSPKSQQAQKEESESVDKPLEATGETPAEKTRDETGRSEETAPQETLPQESEPSLNEKEKDDNS